MDIMALVAEWQTSIALTVEEVLNLAGSDPLTGMWVLFSRGGWIILIPLAFFMARTLYLINIQTKYAMNRKWVLLKINVPRSHEQTVKAIENMYAQLAGAHSAPSFLEKWRDGVFQSSITLEIVSIDGVTSFYIHALKGVRDLIESAVYAQYPDAEIEDVIAADYTKKVPHTFPDPEYELWGAELQLVKKDPYPIKTYRDFEDMVSGEFKDPLAAFFEVLSRIQKGEQFWWQIILTPTDQADFIKRAKKEIDTLKGIKEAPKESIADLILLAPLRFIGLLASPSAPAKPEMDKRMTGLTGGEKFVLESLERKASKIGFDTKMRFIYVGKREIFSKGRVSSAYIGAIKQFNTYNMNSFKPDFKKTGMSGSIILFKDKRNNERKTNLVRAYRDRDAGTGGPQYFLSTEELATIWHFPILAQTKSPSLTRTEAKKHEAPSYIPFE